MSFLTSSDYRPPNVPRHLSYCEPCGKATRLKVGCDEPTCEDCNSEYEKPDIADVPNLPATPFEYKSIPVVPAIPSPKVA